MKTLRTLVLIGCYGLWSTGVAMAEDTLFSNLNQPPGGRFTLFGETFAGGFLTGSEYSLIYGLTIRSGSDQFPLESATAFLYDDYGGLPGALVATFDPLMTHIEGNQNSFLITFGHAGISLSPNHTYWIGLTSSEQFGFWLTPSMDTDSGSGAESEFRIDPALPAAFFPEGGGGSWQPFLRESGNFMFALRGDIVLVPEPGSVALLVLGSLGVFFRWRWKGHSGSKH